MVCSACESLNLQTLILTEDAVESLGQLNSRNGPENNTHTLHQDTLDTLELPVTRGDGGRT